MTIENDIISAICLLTLAWLLWVEFRRRDRSYRITRMIATTLAVAALVCILLPLTYERRRSSDGGKPGILLTEGYIPDSLRAWTNVHPEQKVINWDDPSTVPAFGSLRIYDTLHVFGYGLTKEEWTELHSAHALPSLVFHPSPAPVGVVTVDWQRRLLPGQRLRVQGSLALPSATANPPATANSVATATSPTAATVPVPGTALKLLLTGMGTVLDSTTVTGLPFQLQTIPAPIGPVLYHLLVLDGKDTLEQEVIPAEVLPGKALKILLLASSPGWESAFLLKWLTRNGQGVAARTAISRAKYDIAFVNVPEWPLDHLSTSLLSHFDIVVADVTVLSAFSSGELSVLHREIADRGMGLIIPVDSAGKLGVGAGAPALAEAITTKDSSRGLYIKDRPGLQPLFRDSLSRIQVAAALYGEGRVLFTTRNATWSQALAGEGGAYAAYWSEILQTAARQKETMDAWSMEPALPIVGEPVNARLQTSSPQLTQSSQSPQSSALPQGYFASQHQGDQQSQSDRQSQGDQQSVYLTQDPNLSFNWQGIYWPAKAGWQYTHTGQGDTRRWYAWPADAWPALHRQQRRKETRQYIADQRNETTQASPGDSIHATAQPPVGPTAQSLAGPAGQPPAGPRPKASAATPLPKGWFFVIFLLCLGFLWAERKMEWMSGRIVR